MAHSHRKHRGNDHARRMASLLIRVQQCSDAIPFVIGNDNLFPPDPVVKRGYIEALMAEMQECLGELKVMRENNKVQHNQLRFGESNANPAISRIMSG